jgi:H+/Cl- antiporter ClcA
MLGLALGPQGPSIYVGMLTALLFYKFIFKTSKTTEEEQIILGSSVGYTVAFLNPVAGLCFAMEKSKCKMSIKLVLKLILALVITYLFQTIFRQRILSEYFITLTGHMNYWLLLAIPVIVFVISILGILINTFFSIIRKHINYENKVVKLFMSFLILIFPLVIKVYQPQILGSGLLSLKWIFSDLSIATIAIYGAIRIVFTYFSVETKFSGGVGGSIIIIGAILGRLIAGLFGYFIEISSNDIYIITIATMLSFYGMFTKEKYTSISLIFSFGNFVYLINL